MLDTKNYKIFVDGGADFDSTLKEYVDVLPTGYTRNGQKYEWTIDSAENDARLVYVSQRNGELTETIPIKAEEYQAKFENIVRHGLGVLYISMSSVISKSNYYAKEVKSNMLSQYGEVPFYIVDSLSTTGGIGIILERAINNKKAGYSLRRNAEDIASLSGKIKSWFYMNDLDYLCRDGKTSASKSFFGTLLGIKPIMEVSSDGNLRQINKSFGTIRACDALCELYFSNGGSAKNTSVYITHSDDLEKATLLRDLILKKHHDVIIKIKLLTPIIGAHTGAGVVTIHHYNGS